MIFINILLGDRWVTWTSWWRTYPLTCVTCETWFVRSKPSASPWTSSKERVAEVISQTRTTTRSSVSHPLPTPAFLFPTSLQPSPRRIKLQPTRHHSLIAVPAILKTPDEVGTVVLDEGYPPQLNLRLRTTPSRRRSEEAQKNWRGRSGMWVLRIQRAIPPSPFSHHAHQEPIRKRLLAALEICSGAVISVVVGIVIEAEMSEIEWEIVMRTQVVDSFCFYSSISKLALHVSF
jgi:hypothetical protein